MSSFHDDKLWQEAFTAALDVLEIPQDGDIAAQVRKHAMMVVTEIAQAVSNRDRKMRDIKLRNTGMIINALRSLLSIQWAREELSDDQFGKLDGAYEALGNKLPR